MNGMKTCFISAIMLVILPAAAISAKAPVKTDETATVVYSLPSTTLSFEVEAVCEHFYAGPYAAYAAKYLGIDVRQKDEVSCRLTGVKMTPYNEADHSARYLIDLKDEPAYTTFLKFTSAGLVSSSESVPDREQAWRFPTVAGKDYAGKAVTANLTREATTLYKSVKNDTVFGKVAVRQNMLVEKSEEARAAETAGMIVSLREQRMNIITGNTDASYNGEAMGAALSEISRLERELTVLFTGYSESGVQKVAFDVVPQKNRENQIYVAFRISDSAGLLPADNVSGKPVILEIVPETMSEPQSDGKNVKKSKLPVISYRIPVICQVKLKDGVNVILQGRVPVYQLGEECSLPLNFTIKD